MPVKRTSIRAAVAGATTDTPTDQTEAAATVPTQGDKPVDQPQVEIKKDQPIVIQNTSTQIQEVVAERVKTGFTLRKDLLKDVKRLAVEEETDINTLLEEGMRLVLESRKKTS
ncbi:MAG: hypothetical protein E6J34_20755 [Chloroflexi bacterium]|nr:MAG: hypothetical protein E6J34_20755 [Chloroflexota bacterium]